MKYYLLFISIIFFNACSNQPEVIFSQMPRTELLKDDIQTLPNWNEENYKDVLQSFIHSCMTKKTDKIYKNLCIKAKNTKNPKRFLSDEFEVYRVVSKSNKKVGLLTGYYEASLRGSKVKKGVYKYPIYERPKDLVVVDLSSIYPELKHYRLRGMLKDGKLIPYYDRKNIDLHKIDAKVICYVDSKIDLFFLEVQGSGRVLLDNGDIIYVGFSNQNGYKYRSIGKYLINNKEIKKEDISIQSIKKWLINNPTKIDTVLNFNRSKVFFRERKKGVSGSLGIELTPKRSIAVDRSFIPLGSMLYLDSTIDGKEVSKVVMAQDTGGAIKGAIRADMFLGFGDEAMDTAGRLKSPLKLWIFMPNDKGTDI